METALWYERSEVLERCQAPTSRTGFTVQIVVGTDEPKPHYSLLEVRLNEADGTLRASWTRKVWCSPEPHAETFALTTAQVASITSWEDGLRLSVKAYKP